MSIQDFTQFDDGKRLEKADWLYIIRETDTDNEDKKIKMEGNLNEKVILGSGILEVDLSDVAYELNNLVFLNDAQEAFNITFTNIDAWEGKQINFVNLIDKEAIATPQIIVNGLSTTPMTIYKEDGKTTVWFYSEGLKITQTSKENLTLSGTIVASILSGTTIKKGTYFVPGIIPTNLSDGDLLEYNEATKDLKVLDPVLVKVDTFSNIASGVTLPTGFAIYRDKMNNLHFGDNIEISGTFSATTTLFTFVNPAGDWPIFPVGQFFRLSIGSDSSMETLYLDYDSVNAYYRVRWVPNLSSSVSGNIWTKGHGVQLRDSSFG